MTNNKFNEVGTCPKCGSNDLNYGPLEIGDVDCTVEYPFECNDCGCNGNEVYTLVFSEIYIINN